MTQLVCCVTRIIAACQHMQGRCDSLRMARTHWMGRFVHGRDTRANLV